MENNINTFYSPPYHQINHNDSPLTNNSAKTYKCSFVFVMHCSLIIIAQNIPNGIQVEKRDAFVTSFLSLGILLRF